MSTRYSVQMIDGRVTAVEVNGIPYRSAADVPDPDDREQVARLLESLPPSPDFPAVTPFPVEKVVAWVFAGVAIILLTVATLTGISTARHLAREVPADGRVVSLTPRTVSVPRDADDPDRDRGRVDREYFYPVVEFALPDGTTKTVQTAEGSWPPAYETGQSVAVRYDRENPLDARIASSGSTLLHWTWTLITAPLGLVFAAVSVLIFRVFTRGK